MDRRCAIAWVGAACLSAAATTALAGPRQTTALNPIKDNGRVVGDWFMWEVIGIDPFKGRPLKEALVLMGIPERLHNEIIDRVGTPENPGEPDDVTTLRAGWKFGAMVSGGGQGAISGEPWVTEAVCVSLLEMSPEKKRTLVYRFPEYGFEIWIPLECWNPLYLQTGVTSYLNCRCDSMKGDVGLNCSS